MSKTKTLLISAGILLLSAAITALVFVSEPEAVRETATKKSAMLVNVVEISRGSFIPTVRVTGTVQPARDITLSTQVGGQVTRIANDFTPGSFVKKGEALLQINPADYRNTLQLRKSDLALARSNLSIEMGRQDVARKDFELVGQELSDNNKALVLREPQLESAKASVAAAEAAVNQAKLDLQRTTVRAPFDAHIISRNANVGTQLAPGAEIGRLVGVEEYWIVADVPLNKISWLTFSENENKRGSDVKVISNSWQKGMSRTGHLFRLVGALDTQSRLVRVIISVPDPLVRKREKDVVPSLIIGAFVECHIQAEEIQDVFRLDRAYLRKEGTVWVMKNGKLQIRKVDIVFQDAEYAYINKGLDQGDQVVITDLSTVVEGSELRTERTTGSDTTGTSVPTEQ